jgi:DNA-binding response OmpR family regulator
MPHDRQLSVLIVEDNIDGAETLAILLDMYGHSVRIAFNGEAAMPLAHECPPDAVVLDIGLPGMNGFDVARQIRAAFGSKPRLIAVSGYTNKDEECHAAGIDHYLIKPAHPEMIDALLRSCAVAS